MSSAGSIRNINYADYQLVKVGPQATEQEKKSIGLIDQGTSSDNVLDLSNPDKIIKELSQDKVSFIKISDGLYLKLNLTDKAAAKKLLSDLKKSISGQKDLSKDFSPLVLEKALGLKILPNKKFMQDFKADSRDAMIKFNEVQLADFRLKDIQHDSSRIDQLYTKFRGLVDFKLENPASSDKEIKTTINDLHDIIKRTESAYKRELFANPENIGSMSEQKEKAFADNPVLEIFKNLKELVPRDLEPGKAYSQEKLAKINSLLEKIDKKSPEYQAVKAYVKTLEPILETLSFEKRIVGTANLPERAIKLAEENAKENPGKVYGIADTGQGSATSFRIIEYPEYQQDSKTHQVKGSSGNLVGISSLEDGKTKTVSRLGTQKVESFFQISIAN